jgi:outer membrane protein assembly factor BamB
MNPARWHRVGPLCLLLAGLGLSSPAPGQPGKDTIPSAKLIGNSPRTATRLASAHAKAQQQQWSDAIAEYQSILDDAGDDVMPADPNNPDHCVGVRRLCQIHLASLPPAGLRVYRMRLDESATKALALAGRDSALLRRIVEQAFCSRAAETAIDLLGDLAFARGDFLEAERWWRTLALPCSEAARPKPAGTHLRLAYPDPQTDPALIRAKLILARLFQGERAAAAAELKAFREAHPRSEGLLAGRVGNYAATLADLVEKATPAVVESEGWSTFAGDASRNGSVSRLPKIRWLEETWRARLDEAEEPGKPPAPFVPVRNPSQLAQALAFFPVIAGDRVLVADCRYVTVFDLLTGRRLARFDLLEQVAPFKAKGRLETALPVAHGQRYTLTVDGDRVFVRLGATAMSLPADKRQENDDFRPDSFLVCLRLTADHRLEPRWLVPAAGGTDKESAMFEGSPLLHDGRLYVARTRFTPTAAITQIECYDPDTGQRHWRQEMAASEGLADSSEPRQRQYLLTAAGSNVVYCTHTGAVVAVEAATGKRMWAIRYPRRGYRPIEGRPLPRDLAPALYAAGRVYVAPADSDRVFCLDADTGQTLWESNPVEVVQLLGIIQGRLIFTTGSGARGIRGVDAMTGADIRPWIHPEGGQGELPTLGRGVFAGDRLLWPTSEGLRILKADGQQDDEDFVPLGRVQSGNLAIGNGCVVVATDRELVGYVSPARQEPQRRKAAMAEPNSAVATHRLAVAEADAGLSAQALQHFAKAWELAGPDQATLRDQVRRQAVVLFRDSFDPARSEESLALVKGLTGGLKNAFPRSVWSSAQLALYRSLTPEAEIKEWQTVLGSDRTRHHNALGPDGLPRPLAALAFARINALQREHGTAIYRLWDDVAAQLVAADGASLSLATADRLADEFPNARATRTALARLAAHDEQARDHDVPLDLYRTLYRISEPGAKGEALARLARAYEKRGLHGVARATWERLTQAHGAEVIPSLDPRLPVREHVAGRLQRPEYAVGSSVTPPDLPLPLNRVWSAPPGPERETLLPMDGPPASGEWLLFMRQRPAVPFQEREAKSLADNPGCSTVLSVLTCRHAATGKTAWELTLDLPITWAAHHADLLLAAGPRGVVCLRAVDGKVLWTYLAISSPIPGEATSFAEFQLAASRLFFFQDHRRLFALDVETGEPLWHRWAPAARIRPAPLAGTFQPWYHAGADRVLIQTSLGVPVLLESHTGKELPSALSRSVWLQPPHALNDRHVGLVPDIKQVEWVDLLTGKAVWTYTIDRPTTLSGDPPQVFGQADVVLVAVSRNYGIEVECLEARTGRRRWASPVLFPRVAGRISAALDRSMVYVIADNVLEAFTLADGKRLWRRPLGANSTDWRVALTRRYLLAFPAQATPEARATDFWRRLSLVDSLPVFPAPVPPAQGFKAIASLLRQWQSRSQFAVLLCDPADGQLIQRLNFTGHGPAVHVGVFDKRLVVSMAGAAWGLQ